MSIQTTSLGPNSAYIAYTGGETQTTLLNAIEAYITSQGWTVFDSAAGTNFRIYTAPCADGTTQKYVGIDTGVWNTRLGIRVFEGWNASTHNSTNEVTYNGQAYSGSPNYQQQVDYTNGGYIYTFVSPRYIAFYSKLTANGAYGDTNSGSFTGCFEFSKDNSADTALDQFAWVNGAGLLGTFGTTGNGTTYYTHFNAFSVPKTTGSATGAAAENYCNALTLYGQSYCTSNSQNYTGYSASLAALAPSSNMFGMPPCSPIYACEMGWTNQWSLTRVGVIRGRFYGLKYIGASFGNPMDTLSIAVDANGLQDSAGTVTQHSIIKASGHSFALTN